MAVENVYIAVGANQDPERNILKALEELERRLGRLRLSPFYYSAALRRPAQPRFLNGVLRVRTALPARAFDMQLAKRGGDHEPG
jgi:2-amino-4-hydroxy-6-hydroxymethyldihydropteridine diphosphokinase